MGKEVLTEITLLITKTKIVCGNIVRVSVHDVKVSLFLCGFSFQSAPKVK
jgi:hypothetical protein